MNRSDVYRAVLTNAVGFRAMLWTRLPLAAFAGLRVARLDENGAEVTLPAGCVLADRPAPKDGDGGTGDQGRGERYARLAARRHADHEHEAEQQPEYESGQECQIHVDEAEVTHGQPDDTGQSDVAEAHTPWDEEPDQEERPEGNRSTDDGDGELVPAVVVDRHTHQCRPDQCQSRVDQSTGHQSMGEIGDRHCHRHGHERQVRDDQ